MLRPALRNLTAIQTLGVVMEAKGLVNQYESKPVSKIGPNVGTEKVAMHCMRVEIHRVFTLNLAAGTTPFCTFVGGREYFSNFYQVTVSRARVEYVWYRPDRAEFGALGLEVQDHVLNGGLLSAPLGHGTLADDPTVPEVEYEDFQIWCLSVYGRRLPAIDVRVELPEKSMTAAEIQAELLRLRAAQDLPTIAEDKK